MCFVAHLPLVPCRLGAAIPLGVEQRELARVGTRVLWKLMGETHAGVDEWVDGW